MIRAGVFIGVDKAGGDLRQLKDAAEGATRMHAWALKQGLVDGTHAKLITDASGRPVNATDIFAAIDDLVRGAGVDQLIVYFAGHGVNINRSEHWLLTHAPVMSSAAVNVSGSVELARYCGIQHVVIISDACRVAPEGIQAQNVRGIDIFPNETASDRAKPVDQFFACALGRTAAEARDPAAAAGHYCALYTDALLKALHGKVPDVLEPGRAPGDGYHYVKPRKLQDYLEAEIPRRVKELKLERKVNQNPDALILDHPNWVARVKGPIDVSRHGDAGPPPGSESLRVLTQKLVRSAAGGEPESLDQQLQSAAAGPVAGAAQIAETTRQVAAPFGPGHFETQCGVKVRGARIVEFFAPRAEKGEFVGDKGDLLRIKQTGHPAVSVLLRFEGGFGTVVPAVPGFLAALTFHGGELIDVAYEPSDNSFRWDEYRLKADHVRALRAVAAASSLHGRFRLEGVDADKVARRMQLAKGVDPTLAVYAAYAYYDLQDLKRLTDMAEYQRDDIGVTFFDLALLGRALVGRAIRPDDRIVPFTPLLSQGWSLLRANKVKLHRSLDGIEGTVRESLWSLFDARGVDQLRAAMQTREVR